MTTLSTKDLEILEDQLLSQMIEKARTSFYAFAKLMAPCILPEAFVDGQHIHLICDALQKVYESVSDHSKIPERLQIMLPPGSMKSRLASNLFPAWCLGRSPNWCFLVIGSDFEFAVDNFGRPTKDLIDSPQYQAIFPNTALKRDVQSAGRWDTTKKGRFVARGAGQNIAGRRAHITLVDDAITEQTTDTGRKEINQWYRKGLRTRLLPRGAEIIINTRWFVEDLSGFMLKIDEKTSRPWKVIKIPAILDLTASTLLRQGLPANDTRFEPGTSFWPEFWPTQLLLEKKETMPSIEWASLYMQDPVMEEGSIIKRSDWQLWEKDKPPQCRLVLITLDTALSQKEAANYSAYTVWGVFTNLVESLDQTQIAQDCMILLGSDKGHWDLTELCQKMKELDGKYSPEYFVVEDTSAGMLLIPEMQKRSLPVLPYKPKGDKTFRLQATTPYFQAKRVFTPKGKVWAEAVIEEVCAFQPRLKNQKDDLCFHPSVGVTVTSCGIIKRIDQIKEGDSIMTATGNGSKVTKVHISDNIQSLKSVKVTGRPPILCTDNHPFQIVPNEIASQLRHVDICPDALLWAEAGSLRKGDLAVEPVFSKVLDIGKIDILDYLSKDFLTPTKFWNKTKAPRNGYLWDDSFIWSVNPRAKKINRFLTVDEDFCRLMGYYISEGSCGKHSVSFAFDQKETQYHEDVEKLFFKVFGIPINTRQCKDSHGVSVTVTSTLVREFFRSFIPGISVSKRVPSILMTLPVEKQRGLIQGLYFGDGTWNLEKGQTDYSTASRDLAEQLMLLLPRFGTCASLATTRKLGGEYCMRSQSGQQKPLYLLRNNNQNAATLLKLLNETPKEVLENRASMWVNAGYVWRTVRDLQIESYTGPVYNLEVQDEHTYLVNGISVHNCDCVSSAVIWMRDNFKIDNDGFSNRWDDDVFVQRRRTYWNAMMPKV